MSYLISFAFLLGITGLLSILAGLVAAENSGLLIGYGVATLGCGVVLFWIGRRYRR